MIDLSIVIPTCNRASSLASCLVATRNSIRYTHEIIVVDGASSDLTSSVLESAREVMGDRLRVIREPRREGFVKAVNKGFRAARGRYVVWLNDDARPLANALDSAVEQLEFAPPGVGMLALFHPSHANRNIALRATHRGSEFHVLHVRGTLYANFGMASRSVFERLDYFDERYFINGADPDFSLKVWNAGLSVVPAWGAMIDHDEEQDTRREIDSRRGEVDNAKLFEKWDLPARNPLGSAFDQTQPCTLRGLRVAQVA